MNTKAIRKSKWFRRMTSSAPFLFVICSLPFAAPAHAVVPKFGGTYTVSDDLAGGNSGSVDLAGGSLVLSGSLGQIGVAYMDSSGKEVEGGYFSKYVSTPAVLGYADISISSAAVTGSEATVPNPPATVYEIEVSTASDFAGLKIYVSSYAWPAAVTGLAASTTYYTRLRAVYMGEDPSPYALLSSFVTLSLPPLPAQPSRPTGLALGVSSIAWNWAAVSGATGYEVYLATAPGTLLAAPVTPAYIREGLMPNTTYSIMAAGVNGSGAGSVSLAAVPVATLAEMPLGVSTSAVYATSATLTWALNGNPAGTTAKVLRVDSGATFSTTGTAYTDTGLLGCTSYYFRVRNVNSSNIDTAYSEIGPVLTGKPVPLPPGNLSAESLSGNRIALAWEPAPFEGITGYKLYGDNGTSTINYSVVLATLPAVQTAYTTGPLTTNTVYKFNLRAVHRCGVEENNSSALAAAAALYSLTGVRAAIKIPQSGKKVNGNSVTVMAELLTGTEAETRNILFQYKVSASGVWLNIPAKDPSVHANPDATAPYFIHWDVTALAAGSYDLRVVAMDLGNVTDPSPSAITIIVDSADADINENVTGGRITKEQSVNNLVANILQAGDSESAQVTKVEIPAGALDESTATVEVTNNPALVPPAPAEAEALGIVTEIKLSNQSLLAGGQTAVVTLLFPDVDNNGIVDGTNINAGELEMYSAHSAAGPWQADLSSVVDVAGKKVKGNTTHFSFFALFSPLAVNLNSAKAYPVPWRPGSGGKFDSFPGTDGIIFDNLTDKSEIRIYTITGQLVRELKLTAADLGYKVWDGKNMAGVKAGSGVYLAHIKSGSKVKILKIAVER